MLDFPKQPCQHWHDLIFTSDLVAFLTIACILQSEQLMLIVYRIVVPAEALPQSRIDINQEIARERKNTDPSQILQARPDPSGSSVYTTRAGPDRRLRLLAAGEELQEHYHIAWHEIWRSIARAGEAYGKSEEPAKLSHPQAAPVRAGSGEEDRNTLPGADLQPFAPTSAEHDLKLSFGGSRRLGIEVEVPTRFTVWFSDTSFKLVRGVIVNKFHAESLLLLAVIVNSAVEIVGVFACFQICALVASAVNRSPVLLSILAGIAW
jgi:hypothetical protein